MLNLSMGIDVGQRQSVIFALSSAGEIVIESQKIETFDDQAWRTLLESLADRFSLRACFEVGPHYEWLYDLLMEYCQEVEVVNASDFAVISRSQKKTDKIDAQKLAEGLYRGDLPSIYVPDQAVRADRRLVAFVHYLSQEIGRIKGRIRALLTPHRLRCAAGDVLGRGGREWLENEALPRLELQEKMFLRMLPAQADLLLEQRAELDRRVAARASEYKGSRYLRRIPGCGPLTTLAVVSSVDDVSRFDRPGQLSSYFGVCGSIRQSGQVRWMGAMTKRGNVHVRWLLSQSLRHLHRKDPKAAKRYRRLKRGKPVGVCRGAQMRWLTAIIWRLLTNEEMYRIGGPESVRAA